MAVALSGSIVTTCSYALTASAWLADFEPEKARACAPTELDPDVRSRHPTPEAERNARRRWSPQVPAPASTSRRFALRTREAADAPATPRTNARTTRARGSNFRAAATRW